jgi:polysaccharide biosynthesis/export protein
MGKRIQTTCKFLSAELMAAALLLAFVETSVAQVGIQQMSGASNGGSSSQASSMSSMSANRSGAAASAGSSGLTVVPPDFARLRLAPGFLVALNVLDDPDFVGTFRIDQQGDIALPILGIMRVAGETVPEARAQIQKRLMDGEILKDPQVNLLVLEYTAPEVTIIGEVAGPGRYPLLVPRRLVDVLALAGGTTVAAGNEVQITRGGADADPIVVHYSKATDPKTIADVVVRPGDVVQVKRAGIVYVLGAVTRPGGYVMQEDGTLTVLQAISLANGTSLPAAVDKIYLLRRNADGTRATVAIPLTKMSRGKHADVQLRATDVLYVPMSKVKSILLNSQGILASAASASIYATAID